MRLVLVYAARFYRDDDGVYVQPAYGKYVEGLAAHAAEVVLCGPVSDRPVKGSGYRLDLPHLEVVPLPYFERDVDGIRHVRACAEGLDRAFRGADLGSIMLPLGVLGPLAFRAAERAHLPLFLHIVGDLRGQWSPEDYGVFSRLAGGGLVEVLERMQQAMIDRTFTFVQGGALARKHEAGGAVIREAMETTILDEDVLESGRRFDPESVRSLLYAGNLIRPKGVQVLLRALAALRTDGQDWRLTVAGTGPLQPELESLAGELGIADRVDFVGFQSLDGVMALMDAAGLFVFPSFGEGMPRVMLEAMARGLPIVATDVGGISGVVVDGVRGLLVQPGSAEELEAAVRRLAGDAQLWERFSADGLETAREHTMDRYATYMVDQLRGQGLWPE